MTHRTGWTNAELGRLRMEGLTHLNRLQSGEATDFDAARFLAWRSQSRAHEEAFRSALQLRALVCAAERKAAPENADATILPFRPKAPAPAISRRYFLGGAIAASAAGGAVLVGRTLDLVPSPAEALAEYRTGPGQRQSVAFADGAFAELNTRTAANVKLGLGMPAITLIAGEAVLASGRLLRAALVAGEGRSVVRSGRFNARREGEDVCISCLTGSVEVLWKAEQRLLRAGNQVRYSAAGIAAIEAVQDAAALTAWRSGTLMFRALPLREVVAEINRYRPGRVFLANTALAQRPMTGTYDIQRLDDFFSQAQLALGVRVARLPGNIVVLS